MEEKNTNFEEEFQEGKLIVSIAYTRDGVAKKSFKMDFKEEGKHIPKILVINALLNLSNNIGNEIEESIKRVLKKSGVPTKLINDEMIKRNMAELYESEFQKMFEKDQTDK